MAFKALLRVRFADVDYSGIVHYPYILRYFHYAFEDFFNEYLGVPYTHLLDVDRVGFPSVRVETDFRAPLKFGDLIEVEMGIGEIGERSATFLYWVRRQGDELVRAEGKVVVAAVEMSTFKSIAIPDRYRKIFESYRQIWQASRPQ
jgi:4-hydroxybenzoyl-CoA thioesterase